MAVAPQLFMSPRRYILLNAALNAGAAIYAWMMQQLTVVRSFQTDHSLPNIRI